MTLELLLLFLVFATQFATLIQARRGGGLTRRMRRRDEYAARSVAYAEQLGGTSHQKLIHAGQCFEKLDRADNGKADYSAVEASLAIHAHLGGLK